MYISGMTDMSQVGKSQVGGGGGGFDFNDLIARLGTGSDMGLNQNAQLGRRSYTAIQRLMDAIGSQSQADARSARFGNAADENAAMASRQAAMQLRSQGIGDGVAGGQTLGFMNKANMAKNQNYAWEHSPERQQQQLSALIPAIRALQQGNMEPIQAFLQAFNAQTSRQQADAANSDGDLFGDIIGLGLGHLDFGKLGSIFK